MKFVIWGCGYYGKVFTDIIGRNYVAAFIDRNMELQNGQYQGIPIWSYQTYRENHIDYPIVVSPRIYEEEILQQLWSDGILNALPLVRVWNKILNFLRQIPMDIVMQECDVERVIYVYGWDLLGLLIYMKFQEHGYKCRMIMQENLPDAIREYIIKNAAVMTAEINEVTEHSHILLAVPMFDKDIIKCREKDIKIEKFYDTNFHKELYRNPALEKFKNIHINERCFAVATGPSLRFDDLEKLRQAKMICFSVNGIFRGFDQTKWRPDYYIIDDPGGTLIWHKDILELNVKGKFIADIAWNYTKTEEQDNMYKWHLGFSEEMKNKPKFSTDFSEVSYWGRNIMYDGVLQLAVYMGFKEIYLLGADCCNYQDPKKKHFVSNYSERESASLDIDNIMIAYQSAKEYADAHGIKIYNATRGGALEVFERVDFDTLFND